MDAAAMTVRRSALRFTSDARRVITRPFMAGDEQRNRTILERVLGLTDEQAEVLLARVQRSFGPRHRDLAWVFGRQWRALERYVPEGAELTDSHRQLIGAYFTCEYSFESAALFNPSLVAHPNQDGMEPGAVRFLLSLRATGEGHVSSIVFRCGVIEPDGTIVVTPVSPYARSLHPIPNQINEKTSFTEKLIEMGAYTDTVGNLLDLLPDRFTDAQVGQVIEEYRRRKATPDDFDGAAKSLLWLAYADYELRLPANTCPSEIVIFPATENESRGMEDMRLTRFVDDDGAVTYHGTYTAFNGSRILPQLLTTQDFQTVSVTPIHGQFARNKGMAMFPRRLNGWYGMIGRPDGENLFILRSPNVRFWNEGAKLRGPKFPWEFVQVGNCGPPIETPRGWILLTHGVGPMREYCIGAILLDLHDPSRIIGQLEQPLIAPQRNERDGYVPNVVYSCGSMPHNGTLIVPYAMNDQVTSFATVGVGELLDQMLRHG